MNQDIKEAFQRFKFLKLADLIALAGICSFKSFKKGEFLASEGEYCSSIFLIRKGIVRIYVLTAEGDQRTIRLTQERDFVSPRESYCFERKSTEFLEAVEDCKVVAINIKKLRELSEKNPRILRLRHDGLLEAFNEAVERIEFFTVLSAEQRYFHLLENFPELLQRVPQKYLASFIGVTTVSLSRIRNRK